MQERYPLALAVVACNTASTVHFLHYAKSSTSRLLVSCRRLTCCTSDGKWHCRITGNPRNFKRSYTHELIARFANECQIECWARQRWLSWLKRSCMAKMFSGCAKTYPTPVVKNERAARSVVLGCTHFPLLQEELLQVLQREPGWWILAQRLLAERPGCRA